jgi:tetratricopeptide (TPR) repeat protein
MRYPVSILATLWLLAAAPPAVADQTDARLDALFEELQSPDSPGRLFAIQREIWVIWFMHDDPEVTEAMSRGVAALAEGRHRDAVRLFTRVIELAPEFAEGWNRRATAYYLLGRYHESLADIERVLELEPRHFGALSGRGLCLERLEKPRAALEAFEAALKLNPYMEQVQIEVTRLRDRLDRAI